MEELFGAIKLDITLPTGATKVGYKFYIEMEIISDLNPTTYVNKTFYSQEIIRTEEYADSYKYILPTTLYYTDEAQQVEAVYYYTIDGDVYSDINLRAAIEAFLTEMEYLSISKINSIKAQIAYFDENDEIVSKWSDQFDITENMKICIFSTYLTNPEAVGLVTDEDPDSPIIRPASYVDLEFFSDFETPTEISDADINNTDQESNRINCFYQKIGTSFSLFNIPLSAFYRDITDVQEFDAENYAVIPGQSVPDHGDLYPANIWESSVLVADYDFRSVFGKNTRAIILPIARGGNDYFFKSSPTSDKLEFVVTCYGKNIINPAFSCIGV